MGFCVVYNLICCCLDWSCVFQSYFFVEGYVVIIFPFLIISFLTGHFISSVPCSPPHEMHFFSLFAFSPCVVCFATIGTYFEIFVLWAVVRWVVLHLVAFIASSYVIEEINFCHVLGGTLKRPTVLFLSLCFNCLVKYYFHDVVSCKFLKLLNFTNPLIFKLYFSFYFLL